MGIEDLYLHAPPPLDAISALGVNTSNTAVHNYFGLKYVVGD